MKALKVILILLVLVGLGWFGWKKWHHTDDAAMAGAPGGMMGMGGPMPVPVMTIKAEAAQQWLEFPGTLVAVDTVEIRPRVNGAIQKIYFNPGEIIQKDAALFLIDPRPYQADVNRARAVLSGAQAQSALSQTELERAQRLIGEHAIAQRDLQSRENTQRVSKAAEQTAAAMLNQAELNLNYATIRAPVRGKISRAEITLGNLVSPSIPSPLATIVSVDSIYADFDVDEQTYVTMVRQQKQDNSHGSDQDNDKALPVQLVLNTDESVVYDGHIVSFDNKLDATSGTIRARAIFTNKDQVLVPGMFAKVRLGQNKLVDHVLIPDRLINTDQDKKFVYTVDAKNKIEYRPVVLGGTSNDMRIILSGLEEGDRVVTDGLQRLRPDMPVIPQEQKAEQADITTPSALSAVTEPKDQPVEEKAEEVSTDSIQPVKSPEVTAPVEKPDITETPAAVRPVIKKEHAPAKTSEAMPAPKTLQAISAEVNKAKAAGTNP
jgi:multidrug efflux system membrane fusion protein